MKAVKVLGDQARFALQHVHETLKVDMMICLGPHVCFFCTSEAQGGEGFEHVTSNGMWPKRCFRTHLSTQLTRLKKRTNNKDH